VAFFSYRSPEAPTLQERKNNLQQISRFYSAPFIDDEDDDANKYLSLQINVKIGRKFYFEVKNEVLQKSYL